VTPTTSVPSAVHFGVAGVLSGLYLFVGVSFLMAGPGVPALSCDPVHLGSLAVTAVAIVYSMEESIRTIGRGSWVGWGLLLGNCFFALLTVPVMAIHVFRMLGARVST
jgi:hypothetical protein